jgi:hypothetical protein
VNLEGTWLKYEHMSPVLEGCHIAVKRTPVVTDDNYAALRRELTRDAVLFKALSIGMPGNGLLLFGLTQAFVEPYAASVCVQGINEANC